MMSSRIGNLAKAQAETAAAFADLPALCFPDRNFTHNQIRRIGAVFGTRMAANGISQNSLIWIASRDVLLIVGVLLGAARIGASVIQIGEGAELPAEFTVSHTLLSAGESALVRGAAVIVGEDWSPAKNTELDILETNDDDPWLYVHTSGTTGLPKFLGLSQRMVVERSKATIDDFPPDGKSVLLYPAGSRPWLARALAVLLNGGALYSDYPVSEWAAQSVSLVSGSRPQFQVLLHNPPKQKLARAEVIGARLPDAEAIQLLDLFDIVDDTYGSSETSKCYSTLWQLGPEFSAYAIGRRRDSRFEIVDTNGQPSPAGEFGIVRIRNDYMVSSYVTNLPSTNSTFRDGWFYPGDIASEDETGRIQFQTRLDHIVNIGGEKVNAYTIDMLFRATRGIRDAVVFRNPKEQAIDELFAFVIFEQNANRIQAIESAKYAICEHFGEPMVPRIIRPVAGIPRKHDGSPDRKACADYVLHISSGDRVAPTS